MALRANELKRDELRARELQREELRAIEPQQDELRAGISGNESWTSGPPWTYGPPCWTFGPPNTWTFGPPEDIWAPTKKTNGPLKKLRYLGDPSKVG